MAKQTLEGLILFEKVHVHSKSEHTAPVLHIRSKDDAVEKKILLAYHNDPNFVYSTLMPFNGKYVRLEGDYFRYTFIVDSIVDIDKP